MIVSNSSEMVDRVVVVGLVGCAQGMGEITKIAKIIETQYVMGFMMRHIPETRSMNTIGVNYGLSRVASKPHHVCI